jgi:hypothetical protein
MIVGRKLYVRRETKREYVGIAGDGDGWFI